MTTKHVSESLEDAIKAIAIKTLEVKDAEIERLKGINKEMINFLKELEDQPGILNEDNVKIKRLLKNARGEI